MKQHSNLINYKISPPTIENLKMTSDDYILRRMYKIDWKICFFKWIKLNNYSVKYHTFIEDDSFLCTKNLLYQIQLLESLENKPKPFRTGKAIVSINSEINAITYIL
jgi:hypothetical protein